MPFRSSHLGLRNWPANIACAAAVALNLLSAPASADVDQSRTHVYLFAGMFGAIFSTGMTTIADQLQTEGIAAKVYNHTQWRQMVRDASADYRSGHASNIILVGYSAGVISVNEALTELTTSGVPVRLAIGLDPLRRTTAAGEVDRYINFYNRSDGAKPVATATEFRGTIQNIDMSAFAARVPHAKVDTDPAIQAKILEAIHSAL